MADVLMPQLGETVIEGTITKWVRNVGDSVNEGDVLLEVSTDKVDSEVPATSSGTITEIFAKEGDTVVVGAKLASIGSAGEAAATPAPVASEAAPAAAPAPAAPAAPAVAPAPQVAAPTPALAPAAASVPSAPPPPPPPAPSAAPAPMAQAPAPALASSPTPLAAAPITATGEPSVLSPVVRKMITDNNLDPAQIHGSGAGGRITRADVQALVDAKTGTIATATTAATTTAAGASTPPPMSAPAPQAAAPLAPLVTAAAQPAPVMKAAAIPSGHTVAIPFSNIRRRTAEHMVMSKATSAHTLLVMEIDYNNVDVVRNASKGAFKRDEGFSLTYLPFISRAVIDAIREFPHVNSSVGDNELLVHGDVNLGIAVDLNFEGLLVPVVHGSDQLRLRAIAHSINDVASRARSKKLTVDDLANGTFSITNLGSYGTLLTGAVISQPQVAILSTDGVKKRPVVVSLPDGSDVIVIHPVGNLALTWDHRAFDGAYAAAFMARVRDILETRDWSSEL